MMNVSLAIANGMIANSTSAASSKSEVLRLSYIIVIIIVGAIVGGLLLVYCMCFRQTINKKKIHSLVRETRIEGEYV